MNRLVDELCDHYDVAVLLARPTSARQAQDRRRVQVVERWILARLRNRRFFSLAELNSAIRLLLANLIQRAFKTLPGCRASAFDALDLCCARCRPRACRRHASSVRACIATTTSNSTATTTACRTDWCAPTSSCA